MLKRLLLILVLALTTQSSLATTMQCTVTLAGKDGQKEFKCSSNVEAREKVRLLELDKPCIIEFGDLSLVGNLYNITSKSNTGTQLEMSFNINRVLKLKKEEARTGVPTIFSSSTLLPIKDGAMNSSAIDLYLKSYEFRDIRVNKQNFTRADYQCWLSDK